jgi:hypothetical protein
VTLRSRPRYGYPRHRDLYGPQTVSLLFDDSSTLVSFSDTGTVTRQSVLDILAGATASEESAVESDRLDSPVTCMRIVQLDKRYLIAGDEDGAVRVWNERCVTHP